MECNEWTETQKPIPSLEQQQENMKMTEALEKSTALFISQDIVDTFLRTGSNRDKGLERICYYFSLGKTNEENTTFLKQEFKQGGKGLVFSEKEASAWFDTDGIYIAYGKAAKNNDNARFITWETVSKRISELLLQGQFTTQETLDNAVPNAVEEISNFIWNFDRECTKEYGLFADMAYNNFPEQTKDIRLALQDSKQLDVLVQKAEKSVTAYEKDPTILRFHYYDPHKLLKQLKDLQTDRTVFTKELKMPVTNPRFITQDEIDLELMRGGTYSEGKYRIYQYFLEHEDKKELKAFIKKEYGQGGHNNAFGAEDGWTDSFSSKLKLTRGSISNPYATVKLTWDKVTKRTQELIKSGTFLTPKEIEEYPKYLERQKEQKKIAEKKQFIYKANNLPKEEKKDTLALRLSDFIRFLDNYEKRYLDDYDLTHLSDITPEQMENYFKDSATVRRLIDFTNQVGRSTSDVYNRSNGYEFAKELETLHQFKYEYRFALGDTVHIGATSYELLSLGDDEVELFDPDFPLVHRTMSRVEFDRKVQQNEMNDQFKVLADIAPEKEVSKEVQNYTDYEDSKVNKCADNVLKIWQDTEKDRLTQLVFCDLSTPKGKKIIPTKREKDGSFSMDEKAYNFNVYDDLKHKLINKGIPEHEIAFIHDADTDVKKQELFKKVRSGQVRVLFGSTAKLGAGTNVQDRLIALHDVDCPWRPRDLEQRKGRIVRRGNLNPLVYIYRYVTENTFDAYLYQMIEGKQKFIGQIMTSKTPVRIAEDVDEAALSYAQIKALATGNPLFIEKMNLEMQMNTLKLLEADYREQKYTMEDRLLKYYPQQIRAQELVVAGYKTDVEIYNINSPKEKDLFSMKIEGTVYGDKGKAGKAILNLCEEMNTPEPQLIGTYMGFTIMLSFDTLNKEFKAALKGAISHCVSLGADPHGNITRIDNLLESLEKRHETAKEEMERLNQQMEQTKQEMGKPFERTEEIAAMQERLSEVNELIAEDDKNEPVRVGQER